MPNEISELVLPNSAHELDQLDNVISTNDTILYLWLSEGKVQRKVVSEWIKQWV